jgi:hypothetical protein
MSVYPLEKRVLQDQYGSGTVIESNERHTVIDFDDHGVKKFITTMVALTVSSVPAPSKTRRSRKRKS